TGTGPALSRAGNVPFYISIQQASDNHDILFLKTAGNGKCYAKYVPFEGVLPLTLLNFNAVNKGSLNIVSWQTASEINTDYFSVERSNDGTNFYEIAKRRTNNLQSINNYTYADAVTSNTDVFYRLKSVDADGKFTYSKIISFHQNNNASFKIIPNPAATNCTIYFNAVVEGNSTLKIFDRNGNLQKQILLAPKQTQVSLNVSNLMPGTYFCSIESAGKTFTQKLIVVK
ncbi:MAG: T9SS type A sorting domain-containing protein, partial [Parafilimonas sp.]